MTPKVGEFYQHYKGGTYSVLAIARDTNAPDSQFVIYCEYGEDESRSWARPLEEWRNPAMVDGQPVARFAQVPNFVCRKCASTLPAVKPSEYQNNLCFLCK